jgi:hypothetical protein
MSADGSDIEVEAPREEEAKMDNINDAIRSVIKKSQANNGKNCGNRGMRGL